MITHELIFNILLILIVAWILGGFFTRFGLPVMLGELLAGIILGPPLLGIVSIARGNGKSARSVPVGKKPIALAAGTQPNAHKAITA